jgi:hypothetical protein
VSGQSGRGWHYECQGSGFMSQVWQNGPKNDGQAMNNICLAVEYKPIIHWLGHELLAAKEVQGPLSEAVWWVERSSRTLGDV